MGGFLFFFLFLLEDLFFVCFFCLVGREGEEARGYPELKDEPANGSRILMIVSFGLGCSELCEDVKRLESLLLGDWGIS